MVAELVWEGVKEFAAALDRLVVAADVASREVVTKGGRVVEDATKAHMQGRPGPERRSGALMASVAVRNVKSVGPGAWSSETAPETPYARRIEFGFHGADRLGRFYSNDPLPFLRPGLDDSLPALAALHRAAFRAALKV